MMTHSLAEAIQTAWAPLNSQVDFYSHPDYVLALVFLKTISDNWQTRYEQYQAQYGRQPELVAELLQNERFVVPPQAHFDWLYQRRHEAGNAGRLDEAFSLLETHNANKLRGVFQAIRFDNLMLGHEAQKNKTLSKLLESWAGLPLQFAQTGLAIEALFQQWASYHADKTHDSYTPPEVAQLMVRLVAPQVGESICDPTCGSASLLIKSAQAIQQHSQTKAYALYGQEVHARSWALAKLNLFLNGEDNHRIELGDTLQHPKLLNQQGELLRFDVIVSHPPFLLEKWPYEEAEQDRFQRFKRGIPPRTKADFAFISHLIETMQPATGRLAIVAPHGVLFRGASEGLIRQRLIEDNLLEAVIGLPEKLFYTTVIPTAILVFKQSKIDQNVLFIDASRDFQEGKNHNQLRAQDIYKIIAAYTSRRTIEQYAYLAGPEEIAENAFNLNIARYVNGCLKPFSPGLIAVRNERQQLRAELAVLEEKMAHYIKELGYE